MIAISHVEACDLVVHCASLLRTIFASLARANERVHVRNERNFPQAKLDSEINVRFLLLYEHGGLYFYCIIIVSVLTYQKAERILKQTVFIT